MTDLTVFDASGKKCGTKSVDDADIDCTPNVSLLKQVVVAYQNNQRQWTASTKSRSEVNFSGEKPWRQKGTGRARSGSRASPIWRTGGVAFGPKPRAKRLKISQQMKKTALKHTLAGKVKSEEIILVDNLTIEKPRTKDIFDLLDKIGLIGSRILFLTDNDAVYKSARNIKGVEVKDGKYANAFDLLANKYVVMCQPDFEELLGRAKDSNG
jgi:large subunit ribosomal protein L4